LFFVEEYLGKEGISSVHALNSVFVYALASSSSLKRFFPEADLTSSKHLANDMGIFAEKINLAV